MNCTVQAIYHVYHQNPNVTGGRGSINPFKSHCCNPECSWTPGVAGSAKISNRIAAFARRYQPAEAEAESPTLEPKSLSNIWRLGLRVEIWGLRACLDHNGLFWLLVKILDCFVAYFWGPGRSCSRSREVENILQAPAGERRTTSRNHPTSMFQLFGVYCNTQQP